MRYTPLKIVPTDEEEILIYLLMNEVNKSIVSFADSQGKQPQLFTFEQYLNYLINSNIHDYLHQQIFNQCKALCIPESIKKMKEKARKERL